MIDALYQRIGSLQKMEQQLKLRRDLATAAGDQPALDAIKMLMASLDEWKRSVTTPDRETFQDVLNFHPRVDAFLIDLLQSADDAVLGLTRGHRERLADLRPDWEAAIAAWDQLIAEQVPAFNKSAGPALVVPSVAEEN
jgi:hypothetical protein